MSTALAILEAAEAVIDDAAALSDARDLSNLGTLARLIAEAAEYREEAVTLRLRGQCQEAQKMETDSETMLRAALVIARQIDGVSEPEPEI